jgi:hypothetical protein
MYWRSNLCHGISAAVQQVMTLDVFLRNYVNELPKK